MRYEESMIQKIVVNYIRNKYPDLIFTCAPAVAKSPRQGRENKLMGYQKGWPDLFFAAPRKGYYGLFIELKTEKGKIDPIQEKMVVDLLALGYKAVILRSSEDAIQAVDHYLKG